MADIKRSRNSESLSAPRRHSDTRANQWFIPGDGITREVITADITRYLGPDALVRPGIGSGEFHGQAGYWITAYRSLTPEMIQDLKMDSRRWSAERALSVSSPSGSHAARVDGVSRASAKRYQIPDKSLAFYQDSRTHAARQHWGPSKPFVAPHEE
jgi:hypothetical protein